MPINVESSLVLRATHLGFRIQMDDIEIFENLQEHRTDKSEKILIILENEKELKKFKKYYKCADEGEKHILLSKEHLHTSRNALIGRRFRTWRFIEVNENGQICRYL